ncbi:MAG: GNAT family N-acetyltransferase [Angustibacter sp.]
MGAAATNYGLHWLRSRGLREVMLYVDADNSTAVQTYERLGFTRWDTDVQYARARRR